MHQPTLRLAHKVAIITGAGCVGPGWGNGRATAVRFAQEGAKVFAVDIHLDAMAETQKMISEFGGDFTPYVADVTRAESVQSMVQACLDQHGKIDILVNNVGGPAPGGPMSMSEASFDAQIDLNLKSVF
jgi:NAD(P)-dependent dehydrogenase (short-subunit alcohol dehydrogenase family)